MRPISYDTQYEYGNRQTIIGHGNYQPARHVSVPHQMRVEGYVANGERIEGMEKKVDKMEVKEYKFPDPQVKYKIMPAEEDKKSLDVTTVDDPKKQLKKNNIIIWEYHGGPNQQFYIKETSPNKYAIINVATGFTLQVPNSTTEDEVQIHTNPRNGAENEAWELINYGKNIYKIRSFCGKLLDVSSAWIRDGAPVIQYHDHDGKNQKWKIWPA